MTPTQLIDGLTQVDNRKTASGKFSTEGSSEDSSGSFQNQVNELRGEEPHSSNVDAEAVAVASQPTSGTLIGPRDLETDLFVDQEAQGSPNQPMPVLGGQSGTDELVINSQKKQEAEMLGMAKGVEGQDDYKGHPQTSAIVEPPRNPETSRVSTQLDPASSDINSLVKQSARIDPAANPEVNGKLVEETPHMVGQNETPALKSALEDKKLSTELISTSVKQDPKRARPIAMSEGTPAARIALESTGNNALPTKSDVSPRVEEMILEDAPSLDRPKTDYPNRITPETQATAQSNATMIRPSLTNLELSQVSIIDTPIEDLEIANHLEVTAAKDRIPVQIGSQTNAFQFTPNGARQVMGQITAGLSQLADGTVEIRLNPVELGRITIHLVEAAGGGQSASVLVEKPEVLELLRRNEDLLGAEFEQAGLGSMSFSFDQQDSSEADQQVEDDATSTMMATRDERPPQTRSQTGSRTDLDIRL